MRVLALIATYNEERFIGTCLEHLFSQGVEAYLCDNQSTDGTVATAARYLGAGLRGIEEIPRDGWHGWRPTLTADAVRLPSQAHLRTAYSYDDLDPSSPRTAHCLLWSET